jgi:glucosylceramidase
MKTPVAGTDFMSAGPWYSYNDVPGDVAMKHFSIARDLGPSGVATYIRKARRHGGFLLAATMDYPPDWMLFDVEKNQNIDPRYFGALAGYYLRYLREYEKAGIRIDYLSPFNEPGVYTKIPWSDIRDLIKGHVGPLFAREGVKTRLMLPESCDRRNARDNHPLVLDDPEARRFISVMPYHGYNEADFEAISSLRSRYPKIPLWMTEVCHGYIVRTPREFKLPNDDFADGDHWGNMIFSDMEAGASAWVYWNMILDEKGGPWLVSPVHGNPTENVQQPLVIVNRESGEITYTGGYWYLSHFSRFVRPGSVRVSSSGSRSGVRCLVFKKPGGGFVAQFLNSNREAASISLACRRKVLHLKLPAVSISTCVW